MIASNIQMARFDRLPNPPKTFFDRIAKACELYPCEILFIHRDAEKPTKKHSRSKRIEETYGTRVEEIQGTFENYAISRGVEHVPKHICVVPVRMMEAWLLCEEEAIRKAAGNPKGKESLLLPGLRTLETAPDPKNILHQALKNASGLSGRRLSSFDVRHAEHLVAGYIKDFSSLRCLYAFQQLEAAVKHLFSNYLENRT